MLLTAKLGATVNLNIKKLIGSMWGGKLAI